MKPRLEHPPAPGLRVGDEVIADKPKEPERPGPVVVLLELWGRIVRCFLPPSGGRPARTLAELCDEAERAALAREEAEQEDAGRAWIRGRQRWRR